MLVFALNPCIDAEWQTQTARPEEKNTIQSVRRWAGGKGVNVARWLSHLQAKSVLLLPLGGPTGQEMKRHLRAESLRFKSVPILEETRTNLLITPRRGPQFRFNAPGPRLSAAEYRRVSGTATALARQSRWQILSGSMPKDAPPGLYARLIRSGRRHGVLSALDCDGAALKSAVGARPFLIKPNEFELSEWAGTRIRSEADLILAARKMSGLTHGWVLVSRGARGAVLVNLRERVELKATAPAAKPLNTLGAGDALLAGAISQVAAGKPPVEWLRWGVAAGTAATQTTAGTCPPLAGLRRLSESIRVSGDAGAGSHS